MVQPLRALVRPQVFIGGGDVALRLEDEIAERLDAGERGFVRLTGPPGCGKTAALRHLAFLFGNDPRLLLMDDASDRQIAAANFSTRFKLVVFSTTDQTPIPKGFQRWVAAPWTQDAWIEYVLAAHHDRCNCVMQRLLANPGRFELEGRPALWRPVLDLMAADDAVTDLKAAVRSVIISKLAPSVTESAISRYAFSMLCHPQAQRTTSVRLKEWEIGDDMLTLLRHSFAQRIFAAEHLAAALESDPNHELLTERLPESLIRDTATLVGDRQRLFWSLHKMVGGRRLLAQPMAASLLHATNRGWAPRAGRSPKLTGAYLAGAKWRGIRLKQLMAEKADLAQCDLGDAQLRQFDAYDADLCGATLRGAKVGTLYAVSAKLVGADLSLLRVRHAHFCGADLSGANLEGATLRRADFRAAELNEANLRRTDLRGADLIHAQLARADFSGADLSYADLTGLKLHEAEFAGANLTGATLCKCDLEGMTLPGARLRYADLGGAYLTASRMPNADLRGANLTGAGLAEIDWEQANLRNADLRGCTFHLGSSRSGLVGSPLACEGSRTGFYTDELNEQDFKAPEEIRKANLRGSDLRGARITDVDFYLVDVRDCLCTPEQAAHLRRTGAILETRV